MVDGNIISHNIICQANINFAPVIGDSKIEDKSKVSRLRQYVYENLNKIDQYGKTYCGSEEITNYIKTKKKTNTNTFTFDIINNEPNIETRLTVFEHDNYLLEIPYHHIKNIKLITNEYLEELRNSKDRKNNLISLLGAFNSDFKFNNNNISTFDGYFIEDLNFLVSSLEIYRQMDTNVEISPLIKTKLYNYQKDNVKWMLELKKNPIMVGFESAGKVTKLPDGRFFIYDVNGIDIKGNKYKKHFHDTDPCPPLHVRGGIIMDEAGVGKTLQLITMIMSNPSENTLILVPSDSLVKHWNDQWKLHVEGGKPKSVTIMTFRDYKSDIRKKFKQLIVDELHEVYAYETNITQNNNKNYDELKNNPSKVNWSDLAKTLMLDDYKYKWGVTATPFPHVNSMSYLMNFLTCYQQPYANYTRNKLYYPIFNKLCRRNIRKHIDHEIIIPPLTQVNHMVKFTNNERITYDTEISTIKGDDDYVLRKCCADVMLNINGEKIVELTFEEFYNNVIKIYEDKYNYENNILIGQKRKLNNMIHEIYKYDETYKSNNLTKILDIDEVKKIKEIEKLNKEKEKVIIDKKTLKEIINERSELLNKQGNPDINKRLNEIDHEIYKYDKKHDTENLKKLIGDKQYKKKDDYENKKNAVIDHTSIYKLIEEYKELNNKKKEQEKLTIKYNLAFTNLEEKICKAKQCVMCMSDINITDLKNDDGEIQEYYVPDCHHTACVPCLDMWLKETNKCLECNQYIDKNKLKKITNTKQLTISYGSKINKVLEILGKSPDDKFVIFTQFPDLISKLVNIFNKEKINCLTLTPENIDKFNNNPFHRCMILSSTTESPGIELKSANQIIIFEPMKAGEKHLKAIEDQIIGRINRIGQTKEMFVHRLIIVDTIEEEIYKRNKIVANE